MSSPPYPEPPKEPRKLPKLSPSKREILADRDRTPEVHRPLPHREAPLGAWIPTILQAFGLREKESIFRVRALWPQIAGPTISPRTFPASLTHGVLTIHVKNSIWLTEIHRMGRGLLMTRVNDAGLSSLVSSIQLKVGPLFDETQESPHESNP